MLKRKLLLFAVMVVCVAALFSITAFAAGETIRFKVQTENGIRQESVDIDNFYVVSTTNNNRIITGIQSKIGAKYTSQQIVEISLPAGIKLIEIKEALPNIKTVNIDPYCVAEIRLSGLTGLESITVASGESTAKFLEGCVPKSAPLKEIIIKSTKAQITFDKNAFYGVKALEKLEFGAGENTYTFNGGCFYNTGIKSLSFIDGAKFVFNGDNAFAACANLSYVYAGDSVVKVEKGIFNDCPSLSMFYASAIDTISDNSFKITSGKETAHLKVYIHTAKTITLGQSAFDGRKTEGVTVCVLDTTTQVLKNCKYELNVGIQHKYSPASEEGACVVSYTTDCSCGKVYNAYYKRYATNLSNAEELKIENKKNPDGVHSFSVSSNINYDYGFDNAGTVSLKCAVCGEGEGVERQLAPMVTFLGYSVSEFGNSKCMMAGVRYDHDAVAYYELVTGSDVDFGMVVSSVAALDGNNPINGDGSAYSGKVAVINMAENEEYEAIFKINGLKDNMLDNEFIMSAYVIIGKEVKYFQGEGASKSPFGVTYSQLAN